MIDLTMETALFFIHNCLSLKNLGNLICWRITKEQVSIFLNKEEIRYLVCYYFISSSKVWFSSQMFNEHPWSNYRQICII